MKLLLFVTSLVIAYICSDMISLTSNSNLANTDLYQGLFKVVIDVHSVFR